MTPRVKVAGFIAACALLGAMAEAFGGEATPVPSSARFDFAATELGALPPGFVAVSLAQHRPAAKFQIADSGGSRVLTVTPDPGGDVLYYKIAAPLPSVEESYSFRYSGPNSIVEPFLVDADSSEHGGLNGTLTDLSASAPGNASAGSIAYRSSDASGQVRTIVRGRLRTEPYFYVSGHVYRVDAIADGASSLLTTRVYDDSLGPQTFDVSVKTPVKQLRLYPGLIAERGPAAVLDFAYGRAGRLPIAPHTARRAGDYMNYLGYNAAYAGPVTSPLSLAFQRYFPNLLIKHVRVPDEKRFLPSINAVARYGIDADVLTGNHTTLDSLKEFIDALALPPDGIELWNEPNNPHMGKSYDPNYVSDLPAFAAAVAQAYPRVPIWGPSLLPEHTGSPSAVIKELSASVGTAITAWNTHSYTMGAPENLGYGGFYPNACGVSSAEDCGWYGAPNFNDNISAVMNPARPGMSSEGAASYGTYPEICGHSNVDASTQQAYIQRGMMYNYKLGHVRIFPYKFIDDGGCGAGATNGIMSKIIDSSGQLLITPKPAYVSLVFLDHILADSAPDAKNTRARPLAYALDGATPDVEEFVLAESDGTYRLVLWSDKALWNFNANGPRMPGSALSPGAARLSVAFDKPVTATVFTQTPGIGVWTASEKTHSSTVKVSVDGFPLVIAVAPPSSSSQPIVLPKDVPLPGATETPRPKGEGLNAR